MADPVAVIPPRVLGLPGAGAQLGPGAGAARVSTCSPSGVGAAEDGEEEVKAPLKQLRVGRQRQTRIYKNVMS